MLGYRAVKVEEEEGHFGVGNRYTLEGCFLPFVAGNVEAWWTRACDNDGDAKLEGSIEAKNQV